MPSSSIRSFTDPGYYGSSIRGIRPELTVIDRGDFSATITRIDLHRLWMQRFSENTPRILHSARGSGRAIITFHTQPGPSLLRGGREANSASIARLANDHDYFQRSSGAVHWGSMSLTAQDMHLIGATMAGCDLTPKRDELIVTPPAAAMAKLQRLHAAAGALAEDAPEVIAHDEAARGLEQALILAMVACLDTQDEAEDASARRRHTTIMRRFRAAIAERPEEAIYIPDLCAAIGVPQRTLHLCCHESLGMGPKRYLLLRRMALARHALREAGAARTTVTDIASRFGFWNFGRFAVEFRALYGETPSTTLHSSPP